MIEGSAVDEVRDGVREFLCGADWRGTQGELHARLTHSDMTATEQGQAGVKQASLEKFTFKHRSVASGDGSPFARRCEQPGSLRTAGRWKKTWCSDFASAVPFSLFS